MKEILENQTVKIKFLIGFIFFVYNVQGQSINYIEDSVVCLSVFSSAGHCLLINEVNSIDYGINGIPKNKLILFSNELDIVFESNKLAEIVPSKLGVAHLGLKNIETGDTLFIQKFNIVNDLNECMDRMDSSYMIKSCSKIENSTLKHFLLYNEPNKVVLNVNSLNTDKIKVEFTNGEIIEISEGFIILKPGKEKFSELTFEYEDEIIAKSVFIIKERKNR